MTYGEASFNAVLVELGGLPKEIATCPEIDGGMHIWELVDTKQLCRERSQEEVL